MQERMDDSAANDAAQSAKHMAYKTAGPSYAGKLHTKQPSSEKKRKSEAVSVARQKQKKDIQRSYHFRSGRIPAAARNMRSEMEKKAAKKIREKSEEKTKKILMFVVRHPFLAISFAAMMSFVILTAATASQGMLLFSGGGMAFSGSGFTAEDTEIRAAEEAYRLMEQELEDDLKDLKEQYLEEGYDGVPVTEVQILLEPDIRHDAYDLTALLTVLHGSFKNDEVQETLEEIFEYQYEQQMEVTYSTREVMTEDGVREEQTAGITITVTNHGIIYAAGKIGLTEEQEKMFEMLRTNGNKPEGGYDEYETG